ncbi:LCP family protein [bacterium]|nr:LCP family protein [bacterium]
MQDQVVILRAREVGRWDRLKKLGCLLILALFLAALSVLGWLGYQVHKQIAQEGGDLSDTWRFVTDPEAYVFEGRKRLNILCLGVDYNHDSKGIQYSKGARSDTIIVLSLQAESHKVTALSIPRDLRVRVTELGAQDKINAAFSLGGARRSRQVVSWFLGVPIDYCLVVKVDAAKELVDALGGLNLNVEKNMDYDDNWGNLHIHLKKGPHLLNGREVVGYCRFRHDEESDFGRMRRQQQVLRVVSARLSHSISKETIEKLVQIVRRNVSSDLSYSKMVTLARLFRGMDKNNVKAQSLVVQDDPESFDLLPVPEQNQRQVREVFGRQALP